LYFAVPAIFAVRPILPVVVETVIGANLEDFEVAIHILAHRDLCRVVAVETFRTRPSGRAVGILLPAVPKLILTVGVENLEVAILILSNGYLL
jgi:hypothetical protein